MSKITKPESEAKEEAFEMIELATSELETLARAFDLISEVCEEFDQPHLSVEPVKDATVH